MKLVQSESSQINWILTGNNPDLQDRVQRGFFEAVLFKQSLHGQRIRTVLQTNHANRQFSLVSSLGVIVFGASRAAHNVLFSLPAHTLIWKSPSFALSTVINLEAHT
jgi:hypothetical protein